ncbi:hypothetical protein J3A83DRAFT_4243736 [Scleroderma citrinum]
MAPEMGQARVGIDHDVVLKTFDSPLSTYKRKDDLVTIARALQIVVESKDTITALSKKTRARMDEDPTIAQNSRFSALFGEPCRGQRSKRTNHTQKTGPSHAGPSIIYAQAYAPTSSTHFYSPGSNGTPFQYEQSCSPMDAAHLSLPHQYLAQTLQQHSGPSGHSYTFAPGSSI